jgi:hypothetical protein
VFVAVTKMEGDMLAGLAKRVNELVGRLDKRAARGPAALSHGN